MGGEPTLHKDIFEFVEIAKEITDDIEIYSNCFRPQSKPILRKLKKLGVKSPEWAYKPNGDVPLQNQNQMLAPIDFGVKNHGPCDWHSSRYYKDIGWNCGISVDSEGYSVCIVGGAGYIGSAITDAVSEFGASSLICSRNKQSCQQKSDYITKKYGTFSKGYEVDIGSLLNFGVFKDASV